jgi:lipoprotein signal peptidase
VTKKDILWKIAYLAIAGGVFMIDQTTKAWAARRLHFDGDMPVIRNFLNFVYAQNTGVAFSMFDEGGDTGRWGLSVIAFIAAFYRRSIRELALPDIQSCRQRDLHRSRFAAP